MILISPSKNLNIEMETVDFKFSEPKFKKKIKLLSNSLKDLDTSEFKSLMQISDKLVELNINRYENFDKTKNVNLLKDKDLKDGNLLNKSARELAIVIQSNIKRN